VWPQSKLRLPAQKFRLGRPLSCGFIPDSFTI
jgi:hypothetical protein